MKVPKVLKSVRYSLAAVNSLFLITGLILLILGIVVHVMFNKYDTLLTNRFFTLTGFVIATAVIIFLASILGYYGAISEHFYVIVAYVALLVAVLIFEITITVLGFELQNNTSNELNTPMVQSVRQYYEDRRDVHVLWDDLQMKFECCGVVGQHDLDINRLPVSCCRISVGAVSPFQCTMQNASQVGCREELSNWLQEYAFAVGVTAAFVTCLQVLITAAAGWLAYRSKFEEVVLEK